MESGSMGFDQRVVVFPGGVDERGGDPAARRD